MNNSNNTDMDRRDTDRKDTDKRDTDKRDTDKKDIMKEMEQGTTSLVLVSRKVPQRHQQKRRQQ